MNHDRWKSFASVAIVACAIFIIQGFLPVGIARAYIVAGSTPVTAPTTGSYSINSSLQNLFSPFQHFFDTLQWSNKTTINIHPMNQTTSSWSTPISIWPIIQNVLSQFDDWFYNLTSIRLSGLLFAILNIFSWILGVVKGIVDWLLGLF